MSLDGEVQRRGAFKEGQAFVTGYFWSRWLGLAAFHPLQDDDEALDQLFEVEGPVLMKSCGDMQACRRGWSRYRDKDSDMKLR